MTPRSVNVLFASAGRRVELLRAFRHAYAGLGLDGSIVAVDADPLAPAMQEADRPYVVPRLTDPAFLPALTAICRHESVHAIVPLTDRDIPVLARHRAELEAAGTRVIVVPDRAVEIAADKLATHRFFAENGIPAPRSWSRDEALGDGIDYPAFIRPRGGSAGEGAFPVRTERELRFFLDYVPDPIVQEYLPGPEITTDVFSDFGGRVLGLVSRRRIEVRWGEVAKGVTVFDPEVAAHSVRIAEAMGAVGPLTVQCMMREGRPLFTEVNARFGGGAPLGIAAGMPAPRWLLELLMGDDVEPQAPGGYQQGLYLTRFDDAFLLREEDRARVESRRL